jgi:hypothetical protein
METPRLTEVQNNGEDYSSFSSGKQASPFEVRKSYPLRQGRAKVSVFK